MNGPRQSDRSVVPKKAANKGGAAALLAESLEERDLPKGNPHEQTNRRAQDRKRLQQAQARIRRMAQYVRTFIPKGRARCGNPACRELCGGSPVTGIPTATQTICCDPGKPGRPQRVKTHCRPPDCVKALIRSPGEPGQSRYEVCEMSGLVTFARGSRVRGDGVPFQEL